MPASETQVQRDLQKSRAADRVLDDPQAASERINRRRLKDVEEGDVVVGRVEIRVIEHVERVEVQAQLETLAELELLAQRHVEAYLERPAKQVAPRAAELRLIDIAARCIAWRHAIGTRS